MGLDQCAKAVTCNTYKGEVDFDVDTMFIHEIAYWRKHNALQGWMHALYKRKGGKSPEFNCVNVNLTIDDINQLEKAVLNREYKSTTGFFFGSDTSKDISTINDDMVFINNARLYLSKGHLVYYYAWY